MASVEVLGWDWERRPAPSGRRAKESMNRGILTGVATASAAAEAAEFGMGVRGGLNVPRLRGGGNEINRGYASILAPNAGG